MVAPEQGRWRLDRRDGRLSADQVTRVLELAGAAAATDHTYPFAEDVVLRLRHGADPAPTHLLATDDSAGSGGSGGVAGYAHLDTGDPAQGTTGELVVHPDARRRGLGRQLLTAALAAAGQADPAGRLRVWAHGDHPAAAALAGALGFSRSRVLHQLRRSLTEEIPAPRLPAGVALRPFRPGADEAGWLAVNARAFADHPEQGRWTEPDLRLRMAEPWFDPDGFLLAERTGTGQLLGFHWTKLHGEGNTHHSGPIGEVYVLGLDPAAQGLGLGTALTLAGLRHLRGQGLDRVMLYVDGSNPGAIRLYRKLGFDSWAVDVMYAHPADPDHPGISSLSGS